MRVKVSFASVAVLIALCLTQSSVWTQSLGSIAARKQNLDLPFDAGTFERKEEEEEVIGTIRFYGQQYEGSGVFFVIDRSESMMKSGQFQKAKDEVRRNIEEFVPGMRFGIVFFDVDALKYPTSGYPAKSSESTNAHAIGWLLGVKGGNTSCMQPGLLEGLKLARRTRAKKTVIIYVGDGGGDCKVRNEREYHLETIHAVKTNNTQHSQVNTIGVMRVTENQGRFTRI